jgi:hypothetical protein
VYPTRAQVKQRFQNLLDDPSGSVFTEAVFAEAFGEAYDALFTAFLTNQCPRIELIVTYTVLAGTTSLTAAQMGINDFGDYIYLSERLSGSTDKFRDLDSVERLSQRPMVDRLLEFNYSNDTFYFVGATGNIDLQIKYDSSGEAPISDNTTITVDSSLTFLSNYAVGVAGQRKGYDEIAQRCMSLAVGPKYDQGTIGGELFRIIQPRVRSRQKVQIAHKPYSAFRRTLGRRGMPYVAAQEGTTGGTLGMSAPVQYSTEDGSLIGTVDGSNSVFYVRFPVVEATVYRNGVMQTSGLDYLRINNQFTFQPGSIPQPSDVITVWAYVLSGMAQPAVGVDTPIQYSTNNGSVLGTLNGVNTLFYFDGSVVEATVYRNGVMQTSGLDYVRANNQIVFLSGSIPQASDVITIWVYPA